MITDLIVKEMNKYFLLREISVTKNIDLIILV